MPVFINVSCIHGINNVTSTPKLKLIGYKGTKGLGLNKQVNVILNAKVLQCWQDCTTAHKLTRRLHSSCVKNAVAIA